MSHLHIPDGLLPLPVVIFGLAATALLVFAAARRLSRSEGTRVAPRIAMLSALMLVGMGLPLPILGYHVNLTVLTGIIAGPAAGLIAVFITNLILALIAHGGITTLGLNTLIGSVEVFLGWLVWNTARRAFHGGRTFAAASIAVVVALAVSTGAMLTIVRWSGTDPDQFGHVHSAAIADEHHEEAVGVDTTNTADTAHAAHAAGATAAFRTFATLLLSAAVVGWAVEAAVVGALVQFISRARPEILDPDAIKEYKG